MRRRSRLWAGAAASALAVGLGVLAAWPIYRTGWLLVVAGAGLLLGVGLAAALARRSAPVAVLAVALAFAVTVVPVAMPQALERLFGGSAAALGSALGDGLAAVVLGWKQLLTLALPVGTYQTVLVPAYLVFLLTSLAVTALALRGGRFAPFAAAPLVAPVAFGTVFGSSEVSTPLRLPLPGPGAAVIAAPRELALWLAAAVLGGAWVAWSAGAGRRAALRRGRLRGADGAGDVRRQARGGRTMRAVLGAAILVLAVAAGSALAPVLDDGGRRVPRDRTDPEVVLRERPSPLTGYRVFKRDEAIDVPLFSVSADGAVPSRLRLAVLDAYDGVDFHVGTGSAEEGVFGGSEPGRFTRFPSGGPVAEPTEVSVTIEEGYRDIWAPTAGLGSVPAFSGPRADALADAFYVNRATGGAIAVPASAEGDAAAGLEAGLNVGDGFRATMSAAGDPAIPSRPASDGPALELDAMPELAEWLQAQAQPATGEGLAELIRRLRERGYLSHALSDEEGERLWLARLAERYGTAFQSSAGGHSAARIEQLFAQLNTQQRLAGPEADDEQLVAGVGDDEQFATAAALLARALGFDSRVVLGVRMGEAGRVPGVPDCAEVCTGENIAAWIEVRGDDGVWAPVDTTPQVRTRPSTLEEGEQLPEFPTIPEERDAREVDPPIGVGEPDAENEAAEPGAPADWLRPLLRAVGLSALALALLALPLLFLPLAKRRRARVRRRARDPELRALGAWQELVDSRLDAGAELPPGSGSSGRRALASALGGRAEGVAAEVDRAVFSAEGLTDAEADEMWAAVDADRAEQRAALGGWRRLRARYSLRSYGVRFAVPRRGREESPLREESVRGRIGPPEFGDTSA